MKLFSVIYDRVMRWSRHPHAQAYLMGLSFAEASFFPIPPDVMLAPMSLARPEKGWWYATMATLFSTAGGVFGYVLGYFFILLIQPWIVKTGHFDAYQHAQMWFLEWGFLALAVAGFTPIPYKLFTIAAGAMGMPLLPFIAASLIGRGGRFYLVAGLMILGGEKMDKLLRRYVDAIGWITVVLAVILYLYLR